MRFPQFVATAWLALICAVAPSHAEKRVALVIGNDRYVNLAPHEQLQKAVNDARAVGGALKGIGFEVIAGENLGRSALVGKLDELIQRLAPGDTAFFFFSGHGVALDGVNYILPADVPDVAAGQETRLKREALDEPYIISELTGRGVRIAVMVLDACRTNPFSRPGGRGLGVAKGLAPPPQVQGVFSLYAASSGQAALDRLHDGDPSQNSVFTRVLVPKLAKPGLDLRDLAYEVREEVVRIARTAGHEQRPEDHDGTVGGRVYLAGAPPAGGQPVLPAAVSPAVPDAGQAWRDIQNTTSVAVVDDFIRHFGNAPVYGALARTRLEELTREPARQPAGAPARSAGGQQAMVAPPPATPAAGPCAGTAASSGCAAPLTAGQERGLKPGDVFRECEKCPEVAVVPAGAFTMGSPPNEKGRIDIEAPHVVTIAKPFAVGRLHVTVDQYAAFVRETGQANAKTCRWNSTGFAQDGTHPVVCVSWEDAKAYVDWLAQKTGKPYRLLSEAEWEYAARGRTSPGAYPRFWFGDSERDLCRYGNYNDRKAGSLTASCDDGYDRTSPAGHYEPNAFGLHDMFGNALQWTEDCWHGNYNGAPADGSPWTEGCTGYASHVARGGSWVNHLNDLRTAMRFRFADETYFIGFRVARTLTP